jgi:hypothetical protein
VPTINLAVSASTDDTNSQSNATATGGSGNVIAADMTATLLSPGSHGASNFWYVGCRFLSATIPQGSTINSATFSLFAVAYPSPGTINHHVVGQLAANPATFGTAAGASLSTSRTRTTASVTWNQKTTTNAYQAVDVTTIVQEIVNQATFASGNAIVIIVEVDATTTSGEWQDYSSWDNADTNNPKLDITYGGAASTFPPLPAVFHNPLIPM